MRLATYSITGLLLASALLTLGACSILPKQEPSDVYRLPTAATNSEILLEQITFK